MSDDSSLFESPIKVRYRKLPTSGKVLWPIIDIKLLDLPQPILALVDSGASHSILHEDIAEIVGLQKGGKNELIEGTSAAGSFKFWRSRSLEVDIYGRKFDFNFSVPVKNKGLIWPCILGHDSIFRIAKLEFKTFKGHFRIFFRTDIN